MTRKSGRGGRGGGHGGVHGGDGGAEVLGVRVGGLDGAVHGGKHGLGIGALRGHKARVGQLRVQVVPVVALRLLLQLGHVLLQPRHLLVQVVNVMLVVVEHDGDGNDQRRRGEDPTNHGEYDRMLRQPRKWTDASRPT